jgi:error-prone DNA polymerase
MLVRTRPETMDHLAVQVAIVRPGPIVAGAVNPYVRRREQQRYGSLPRKLCAHHTLEPVLADTLGVIVYQDQVMEVCKKMAGFTDGEADQLRRAMSRKRSLAAMERFRFMFMEGAAKKKVSPEIAEKTFEQVVAFSEFGFPKSHAAAFAVLAYQSVWLLHYYPAEFYAALLNNQPMGFYGVDTLVREAERRGIQFVSPDLNASELGCSVDGQTVRLGLARIKGVGKANAELILAEREDGGAYVSPMDFVRRTRLTEAVVENLILVGALDTFGENRRELLWQLGLLEGQRGHQFVERADGKSHVVAVQSTLALPVEQDAVTLARPGRWERMSHEHQRLNLSLEGHPLRLLRPLIPAEVLSVHAARRAPNGSTIQVAGLVTTRQRPQTAHGILFLLLEDETGMFNVVVRPELYEAQRETYRTIPLLVIQGTIQRRDRERNLLAEECWPLAESLPDAAKSAVGRRVQEALRRWHAPPSHNFH